MAEPALSFAQKLRFGGEAAAFFLSMAVFRLLGVDAASAFGGFIGREVLARTRVSRRARDNLAAAMPETSEGQRDAILRTMWDNLGRTVAELAHLDKFDIAGPDPRIVFEKSEILGAVRGRGALVLSGHFSNWEILPITGARFGIEGAVVYRPPNNPLVDRYIVRARALKGFAEQISKHHGTRRIFTLLRGGKAILMLADQKTNEGIAVPFFGRDAMTTPAPAALALKLNVPIVFASNRRGRGARFVVTMHPALDFTPSGDHHRDVHDLTAAINARLEEMVRAAPGQWLWIHRRWPTERDVVTGKRS